MSRNDVPSHTQGARTRRSGTRTASTMLSGFVVAGLFGVGAVGYFANQTVLAKNAVPAAVSSPATTTTQSLSGIAFRSTATAARTRGDDSRSFESSDH